MRYWDIHADDYGLSLGASEDILKCIAKNALDSISVLTNMPDCGKYAERFKEESKKWKREPLLSVHLNFVEGRSMAGKKRAPHLTDDEGLLRTSWGKLFFWSFCPWKYHEIKKELKWEIKAQTDEFIRYYGDNRPLRFDGHQHTQMLPVVYHALLEAIREEGYSVEYIRVTKEPVLPFLKGVSLWKTYRPVNCVKNLLLNLLALRMERTVAGAVPEQKPMFLWGVLFSGCMDEERVRKLLPLMKRKAKERERILEILFHPGFTEKAEMKGKCISEGASWFYCSEGRKQEFQTVMKLKGVV